MEIGNPSPIQPLSSEDHRNHGAGARTQRSGETSFSAKLSQAINLLPGHVESTGNSAQHAGGHHLDASNPNGFAPPAPLPRNGANHASEHGVQEAALGVRAYRQQLIAANIANADTPNFKAVDIDLPEALRIAQSASNASQLSLLTTMPGHIPAQALATAPPYPLKYHTPSQVSADGNTVEMDVERSKFAENAVMYEFSLDRVGGHLTMMKELFQTLKD